MEEPLDRRPDRPVIARFGPFELDGANLELRENGVRVLLPPQPFRLLAMLVDRGGEVVTHEEIRRRLWGEGVHVDFQQSLHTEIKRLRRALGDDAREPKYIETRRQHGYRFIAPVALETVGLPPGNQSAATVFRRRALWAATALAVVALVVAIRARPPELDPLARWAARDPEAVRLYLLGRHYWKKRDPQAVVKSVDFFEQAAARAPETALTHAGLAQASYLLGTYAGSLYPGAFAQAKTAARRALELDPRLGTAHAVLGAIAARELEPATAEHHFRRGIALQPSDATAHQWFAVFLAARGRSAEALAEARRAVAFEPLSLAANSTLGWLLYCQRRYDEAIDCYQRILEIEPSFVPAREALGLAYGQKGLIERAVDEERAALELAHGHATEWIWAGDESLVAELGHALAAAGRREEALELLRGLAAESERRPISPFFLAQIHLGLGETRAALAGLEEAFPTPPGDLPVLLADPRFDPLRAEPRFQRLLRRLPTRNATTPRG